jgi:Taurine catabolism dioxygenase TauD, TfdA family
MGSMTPTEWGLGKNIASGQMEPIYDLLSSYDQIPKEIKGRTVWTKEELENNKSRWIRVFTESEVSEIEAAINVFETQQFQLADVSKSTFPLPNLSVSLLPVRDEVINGIGFVVLRGLPVKKWTTRQASIAYLGIGSYFGRRVSQNRSGHVLGHIKDLSEGKEVDGGGRIYRTHKAQTYHSDDVDIVGLLCLETALSGGESQVVSSHHLFNTLQKRRPDVVEQLSIPQWFYDRKGEKSHGQKEWMRTPGYYYYDGILSMKWDSYYVGALQRFWEKGLLPPYTSLQHEAMTVTERACEELSLEMLLEVGDIQLVANTHNLHARSAYQDDNENGKKRWLQRLWLAVSEREGGWKLPFADSQYEKRGGVQVNDTPESYPMEAE